MDEASRLNVKCTFGKKFRSVKASKGSSSSGFSKSESGSNAISSGDSSSDEGESEVMMKRDVKRVRREIKHEEERRKNKKRKGKEVGCSKNLILISDSDEEEEERETESSDFGVDEIDSTSSSASVSEAEFDNENDSPLTDGEGDNSEEKEIEKKGKRKEKKNQMAREKIKEKGKEKQIASDRDILLSTGDERDNRKNKEMEKKGKQKEDEKETKKDYDKEKKDKEKINEKDKLEKIKEKGKEKKNVSDSVISGWATALKEAKTIKKSKQRKPNPAQLSAAWRTRYFDNKECDRVDYKKFYISRVRNLDSSSNSTNDVVDLDSDSESEFEPDSWSGLNTIIEEEEESDSDSESYIESDDSSDKANSGNVGKKRGRDGERKRYEKHGHEKSRRRKKYEKHERFTSLVSSDTDNNRENSKNSSMDEIPLSEKMHKLEQKQKQKRKNKHEEKMNQKDKKEKKERRKRKRRNSKGLKFDELMTYIMNTMNNGEEEEVPECSRRGNSVPKELPILFSWDPSDDEMRKGEKEENEEDKFTGELWGDYDLALETENLGTYNANEVGSSTRDKEAFYKEMGDYCKNGEHDIFLDEQIGYRCRNCSFVETEIRDIMPSFAKNVNGAALPKNTTNLNDPLNYVDLDETSKNPSLTKTGTVWDLIPGTINSLYPHQKEAFEFMWKNLAGGIHLDTLTSGSLKSDDNGGCVISHAPGTGKTRLAIVFIQTYIRAFPGCNPVVVAPAGILQTWEMEFKKWGSGLPFHNMKSEELTGNEDKGILKMTRKESNSKKRARMVKFCSWVKGNSVLGISYSLFNKYISDKSNKYSKERELLITKPGLLILDEGHIPRNNKSGIWNAFSEVQTGKRIILSGTPFQNNFLELYNSLCIVRPKFADKFDVHQVKKKKGAKVMWTTTTKNITPEIVNQAREILMPFVHVHNGIILQSLPGLRESIIVLHPESIQNETILELNRLKNNGALDADHKMSLASVHPFLLTSILDMPMLKTLNNDPYAGVKTKFVIELVRLCNTLKERVLIFSQHIAPLDLIQKHLMEVFNWREGNEVLQIYGGVPINVREGLITKFNDLKSEARVFLASIKACSEGISLTGASRVVLLDVVWNPSVGKQAISRAFRIGQEKVVYTYNLITTGTGEMEKYGVQGKKEKVSKLVFSLKGEMGIQKGKGLMKGWYEGDEDALKMVSDDRVLEAITENEKMKGMFANIYYIKSGE